MTDLPLSPAEEADALAAEYVLGVLDLPERMAVEQRLKNDAAFRAAVEAWEQRLAPLSEDYETAAAPDHLAAIEARLFPQAAPQVSARRWTVWGWMSGAVAAVAVGVAVLLMQPPPMEDVAMLATEDHSVVYMVQHQGEMMKVTRMEGSAAPAGQVHELWIIPPGGAPQSLGLLVAASEEMEYPMPAPGWTLAVSMEPAGGSPSGLPTGPVLMAAVIGA